ncbi:Sigma-70 region 2 [Klebsiella pneumoniae]|uniref:RNA polymerase sigma factor n=1 Tax=Klebsiella pneumoniae TaxID=573 RepID=A0A2X3BW50_KLEPN|nr:Sigma-70 region 2 [Klebsiella pneumoniae]
MASHHDWLKSWLTRKLQSAFDADDIAQDTFLRVMGNNTLSTIRDPRSFLCTIAKRVMGRFVPPKLAGKKPI